MTQRTAYMVDHSRPKAGVGLIEVLISILIIVVGSIATLSYFAATRGYISKTGNRRAALEHARQRLDQLLAVDMDAIRPTTSALYYVACDDATGTCGPLLNADPNETCSVGNLPGQQKIVSTVQCQDDAFAGTLNSACDTLVFSAKVWFLPDTVDDDFHRVQLRTLRTP